MNIVLPVTYLLLLILTLSYGGVIIYHVFKYRGELLENDARRATNFIWCYLIIGGAVLVLSIVIGAIYWLIA